MNFIIIETIKRDNNLFYAETLNEALDYVAKLAKEIDEDGELEGFDEESGTAWGETANHDNWDIKIVSVSEIQHI